MLDDSGTDGVQRSSIGDRVEDLLGWGFPNGGDQHRRQVAEDCSVGVGNPREASPPQMTLRHETNRLEEVGG